VRSLALLCLFALLGSAAAAPKGTDTPLPVTGFRLIERESGPVNYYSIVGQATPPHIRAQYRPPYRTAVMGHPLSDADRAHAQRLRWRWRALTLPTGGNECAKAKNDSAAVIYVSWKRGLRYYTLKYVWSTSAKKGTICDRKRNPFVAQDTIVLESGGPLNEWRSADIDLRAAFRKHFEDGNPNAEIPELLGVAIMSDGDQTKSESSADYADFVISR